MRKLLHTFSIQVMLMATVFLTAATMVISLIMSHQYTQTLKQQTESTTLAAFRIAAGQIDHLLSDARTVGVHAFTHADINRFLTEEHKSALGYIESRRKMVSTVRDYLVRYPYLNGLLFITEEGVVMGAMQKWTFTSERPVPFAKALVDRVAALPSQRIYWLGAYHAADFFESQDAQQTQRMTNETMVCAIEPRTFVVGNRRQTLYVLVSLSPDAVSDCYVHLDDEYSSVALLNQEGRLIDSSVDTGVGTYQEDAARIDPDSDYGALEARLRDGRYQLIYHRLPSSGWLLKKTVPLAVYNESTDSLRWASLWTCLIVMVAACTAYGLASRRFMRPFSQIVSVLRSIERAGDSPRMEVKTGVTEFNLITGQFNRMMDRMDDLHRRDIEAQRELLILEIRNLQAQINPHFIYNSIASIRWLATILGADKVASMLVELAEILKPVFSEWRLQWQLKEELDFIRHYMRLMEMRYGADIAVRMDCPEEVLEMYIPRFILQPILENACEHGKSQDGRIDIELDVLLDGDDAILRVQDSGMGIPPEHLALLRLMLRNGWSSSAHGAGIGLCNVHRRVQLYCGKGYGVSIMSEPGLGARFDVRVKMDGKNDSVLDGPA